MPTQVNSYATSRHQPKIHGVKVTIWWGLAKHLSWALFGKGAKVQMEEKRVINQGPHFAILVLVLDSLTGTNTYSSSYLIDMHENCLLC